MAFQSSVFVPGIRTVSCISEERERVRSSRHGDSLFGSRRGTPSAVFTGYRCDCGGLPRAPLGHAVNFSKTRASQRP
jgi:hypothetical protein